MELMLTNNPMCHGKFEYREINPYFTKYANEADQFNIATGFVTNESIVELDNLVKCRMELNNKMKLNLLIGMNYFDGFTRLQYDAIHALNDYLIGEALGGVYLSTAMRYHGKIYSFLKNETSIASFVGSSNLGSFVGTSAEYIESDVMFSDEEANKVNERINNLIEFLGTDFNDVPQITKFKEPKFNLLSDNNFVKMVTKQRYEELLQERTGIEVELPLKTEPKSNLNAFFGKGKLKGKYSPRHWYEVEYIINKNTPNRDKLPELQETFTVITDDLYQFDCDRQGDYAKNLRTIGDLRILGKWIKGHMEAAGALRLGEPVTEATLQKFHKTRMVLEQTTEGIWLLKMV